MIKLYKRNAIGIGTWRIWSEGNTIYIAHATVEGGCEVVHSEVVTTNQSGRTLDQQILLRINSRVNKQYDKGYKPTREEACSSTTNQLGFLRPMLAQPINRVSSINYKNAMLQKKLDGHRCLINNTGDINAYSRQGKLIQSIEHITKLLKDRLPMDETLDGELYCHGVPLQTIGSWIKRKQVDTTKLKYVVYDMIGTETFSERYKELQSILAPFVGRIDSPIIVLPCRPYVDDRGMWDYFGEVRQQNFEGLILRTDDRGYQDGIRSSSLLKIKAAFDTEVEVVDMEPSKEGWAICICKYKDKTIRVSAPGTKVQKKEVLDNKEKYIGRFLTIEYAYLTIAGVPFQPVAIRWREDI